MSLIKKANELQFDTKIKALIYGAAGSGKTTLALSMPKPLIVDFDNGVKRVNFQHLSGVSTVQVKSYQDLIDVLDMEEELKEFETIIIDTGGKCLDFMGLYLVKNYPKLGKADGSLTLQGYGARKTEFSNMCAKINIMGKHVLFVAHRESTKDGDDIRYVPLFGGSNYDALVTDLDVVGYIELNGRKRVITFDPTSRNDGKNTCNLPPIIDIPVLIDSEGKAVGENNFLQKYLVQPYTARLKERQETLGEYEQLIMQIKEDIELITDAKSATEFVVNIDSYKHIGSSKAVAAKMLKVATDKLGLKFNKKLSVYE